MLRKNRRMEYAIYNLITCSHAIRERTDTNPSARIYFLVCCVQSSVSVPHAGLENMLLRKTFRPERERERERERLTQKWTALNYSQNIMWVMVSRRMRWAGHMARMGKREIAYRILVGKPEGMKPVRRPRSRWEVKWILTEQHGIVLIRMNWLRRGKIGTPL